MVISPSTQNKISSRDDRYHTNLRKYFTGSVVLSACSPHVSTMCSLLFHPGRPGCATVRPLCIISQILFTVHDSCFLRYRSLRIHPMIFKRCCKRFSSTLLMGTGDCIFMLSILFILHFYNIYHLIILYLMWINTGKKICGLCG